MSRYRHENEIKNRMEDVINEFFHLEETLDVLHDECTDSAMKVRIETIRNVIAQMYQEFYMNCYIETPDENRNG